MEKIVEIVNKW